MKSHKSSTKPRKLSQPIIVRYIQGLSMVPVLPPGTMVWGWVWFRHLKEGDVVIFVHEGKEKIKRISEIKDDQLYLLGDHEEESTDSRTFGWVESSSVLARVIWPHAPQDRSEHFSRSE